MRRSRLAAYARRIRPRGDPSEIVGYLGGLGVDSIAIDCGANIGNIAVALARRCSKVIAFEPNPDAFAVLERRLRRRENVQLFQAAVGSADTRRPLYLHVDSDRDPLSASVGSSLERSKLNVSPETSIEVDVIDLDRYIANLDRHVDLLKLDVEGAEIEILERFVATGRLASIGIVIVEMHDGVVPELSRRGADLRESLADPAYANVHLDWG